MGSAGIIAAWDGLGFLIFFLVAFASWLINFLGPKPPGQVNPRRRPQNPGQGRPVQTEMERFLQQAREAVEKASKPPRKNDGDVVVVQAPPQEQHRRVAPPPQRRRSSQEVWEKQANEKLSAPGRSTTGGPLPSDQNGGRAPKQPKKSRPGDKLAGRHIQSSIGMPSSMGQLGETRGIGQAQQVAAPRASQGGNLQSDSVFAASLSQTSSQDRNNETLAHKWNAASEMARKMRSPASVRDAIMMSEILARPLALRRGK